MSGEEFDWWFDGNPAGSLRSVAVVDDRVVAVAGHSLYAVALEGELRTASFSVHAVTHPSARGRGIFVELERKHEREAQEMGVACVLAFASAPTAPLFLGPLGWTAIGKLRVWARPAWGTAASTAYVAGNADDAAADWPNHVVRDGEYLQVALSQLAARLRVVRHRRRLRGRLAGQATQGADDLRGRRPRRPSRSPVRGTTAGAGAVAVRAAGARAAARLSRGRLPAHAADAELHGQGTRWVG